MWATSLTVLISTLFTFLFPGMCFPQSAACERRRSSAGLAARAEEKRAWRKLLPPRLLQESARKSLTRLRDWGRSRVRGAGKTVNIVSDWVSRSQRAFLLDRIQFWLCLSARISMFSCTVIKRLHCKKRLTIFPSPDGMSLTFPGRE
jgi:hypothetical protein